MPPHRPTHAANNDTWFHIFFKWIHGFNLLNSHVNSMDSVKNLVCWHVFTVKTRVFHTMTHTNSNPVQLVSNSFKTCDNRQNTCIHMNPHENTYWWSGTNYEPVWHVPTGSEIVPCLLGWEWRCTIYNGWYCTKYYHKRKGLIINTDMKVSEQCGIAASKGNQIPGLIQWNIVYK